MLHKDICITLRGTTGIYNCNVAMPEKTDTNLMYPGKIMHVIVLITLKHCIAIAIDPSYNFYLWHCMIMRFCYNSYSTLDFLDAACMSIIIPMQSNLGKCKYKRGELTCSLPHMNSVHRNSVHRNSVHR